MILIGQYDSPFVRRVAVAMHVYGLGYEHRPWSTFGDAELLAGFTPLRRVPVLVLDDGEVLIESGAILDYLDERVGHMEALIPREGSTRRHMLKICALATGLADKAVALIYERVLHTEVSPVWTTRCRAQLAATLDALEAARAQHPTPFWFGVVLGHADVAVACALRFLGEAHPDVLDAARWPQLAAHAARCEALPVFQAVVQPFLPPK